MSPRRAPLFCSVAVIVACAAIAGCGGGSGESAQGDRQSAERQVLPATLRPICNRAGIMPGPVAVVRTPPGGVWIGPALFGAIGHADDQDLLVPARIRGEDAPAWAGKFFLIVTGSSSPVSVSLEAEDGSRAGLLYDIRLNEKLSRRTLTWRDLPQAVRAPLCASPKGRVPTGYPGGFVLEHPGCVRVTVHWSGRQTSRRLPVGTQAVCEARPR